MKHRLATLMPFFGLLLLALMALGATLSVALSAHEGQTRVALFATPSAWAAVDAAGLPVVRLAMGGLLIVVDGAGAPRGLAQLRAGALLLLDATRIPGCEGAVMASGPGVPL